MSINDRDIQNPRNSGLIPVNGATDFSIDAGSLKSFGDIRVFIRDAHTFKPVYYFHKPLTQLPSGLFTVDLSTYIFAPPVWQPQITASAVVRVDERGETSQIQAQEIDGIDRLKHIVSVVWPSAFNSFYDLDNYFTYYVRRAVGNPPIDFTLSESGTINVDDGTITYDLRLVYGVSDDAPVYNLSELPVYNNFVVDGIGINTAINPRVVFSGDSPYGLTSNVTATAALMFPRPILDDENYLPVITVDTPYVPQDVGSTMPIDGAAIVVPCVTTQVFPLNGLSVLNSADLNDADGGSGPPGLNWTYAAFAALGVPAAPEDPLWPDANVIIEVNGGQQTLTVWGSNLTVLLLREPVLGEVVVTQNHTLDVALGNFGGQTLYSIAEVYASIINDPTFTGTIGQAREEAKNRGYPVLPSAGSFSFTTRASCGIDYSPDGASSEYLLGRAIVLGVSGFVAVPVYGGYYNAGGSAVEQSAYRRNEGVYRIYVPGTGIVEQQITNESPVDQEWTYDVHETIIG